MFNFEMSFVMINVVEFDSVEVDLEVLILWLLECVCMVFVLYVIEGYWYEEIVVMLGMVIGFSKV